MGRQPRSETRGHETVNRFPTDPGGVELIVKSGIVHRIQCQRLSVISSVPLEKKPIDDALPDP